MKKGTYVSRSVYTKLQMDNKRLLKDIYSMVMSNQASIEDRNEAMCRWRNKFESDKAFRSMLRELLQVKPKEASNPVFTKEQEAEICRIVDARTK